MNEQMQEFARRTIKEGLAKLPENWNVMFKRMYANGNLDTPIDEVVDNMPADKLDHAMAQVENSLRKIAQKEG